MARQMVRCTATSVHWLMLIASSICGEGRVGRHAQLWLHSRGRSIVQPGPFHTKSTSPLDFSSPVLLYTSPPDFSSTVLLYTSPPDFSSTVLLPEPPLGLHLDQQVGQAPGSVDPATPAIRPHSPRTTGNTGLMWGMWPHRVQSTGNIAGFRGYRGDAGGMQGLLFLPQSSRLHYILPMLSSPDPRSPIITEESRVQPVVGSPRVVQNSKLHPELCFTAGKI